MAHKADALLNYNSMGIEKNANTKLALLLAVDRIKACNEISGSNTSPL
jgi:hypothetical protein